MTTPIRFGGRSARGSALVVTLLLIVLVTILLVGFMVTSRMEQTAARSQLAGSDAARYARIGVDSVMAKVLATATPANIWISQPGRLVVIPRNDVSAAPRIVELSSGGDAAVVTNVSVDLNPPSLTDRNGLLTGGTNFSMPVKWIYVRGDGTYTTNCPPVYDPENPVVGRYAFWADDNSARINWNTAWTKSSANTHLAGHPSRVALAAKATGITEADANAVNVFRTTQALFDSPKGILALTNAATIRTAAVDRNFDFTHYSLSPDLSIFQEPRIMLTTQQSRAGAGNTNFIDIMAAGKMSADPGRLANLDAEKVNIVFQRIYNALLRTDWPLGLGAVSFVQKYQAPESCVQMVLNIIDYVRSVESSDEVIEPLRATVQDTGSSKRLTAISGGWDYMGNSRHPIITEMAVAVSSTPQNGKYNCTLIMEIFLPDGAGRSVDLTKLNWYYNRSMVQAFQNANYISGNEPITQAHLAGGQSTVMAPGEYRVLTLTLPIDKDARGSAPPRQFFLRCGLFNGPAGNALDFVNFDFGHIIYNAIPGVAQSSVQSFAVEDPIVNKHKDDWKLGPNTFGSQAANRMLDTSISPQQDTESSGTAIEPASVLQSIGSARGVVSSTAELGLIHTGLRGKFQKGTPWRTLRLQPHKAGDTTLPDWALMDLFSAPLWMDPDNISMRERAAIRPHTDVTGGRVNLNSAIAPFANDIPLTNRRPALEAVLQGANSLSGYIDAEMAGHLAANIAEQKLATAGGNIGRIYGPDLLSSNSLFLFPGNLSEIEGIADGGEASESLLRDIAGLFDCRGNVFSVYSVGQSVRQLPDGHITILGEKRFLSIFEKSDSDGKVIFERELGL